MLTASQAVDLRRWLGYPTLNAGETDYVFSNIGYISSISLTHKLAGLSAAEELVVLRYLQNLSVLEVQIFGASDNLDTDQAAVWVHNKREVADRTSLYNQWRRNLCEFLGFKPGPSLGGGGAAIVRA